MESFKQAIKEALRIMLLSIIPVVLAGVNMQTGNIAIDYKVIIAIALVTVLRFADKWLHEWGKDNNHKIAEKGITQF